MNHTNGVMLHSLASNPGLPRGGKHTTSEGESCVMDGKKTCWMQPPKFQHCKNVGGTGFRHYWTIQHETDACCNHQEGKQEHALITRGKHFLEYSINQIFKNRLYSYLEDFMWPIFSVFKRRDNAIRKLKGLHVAPPYQSIIQPILLFPHHVICHWPGPNWHA